MFKTIFQRLLVTYLLLALTIIAALSLIVSVSFSRYSYTEQETSLRAAAAKAQELSTSFEQEKISQASLDTAIDALGDSTDSLIYIMKVNKTALQKSGKLEISGLKDKTITEDIIRVLNGEEVFKRNQYSEDFDMDVLLIGYPVESSKGMRCAVLLMHPLDSIKQKVHQINGTIWIAALLTLAASIPVIYFHASKISAPIVKIERDARRIAAGESFSVETIASRDEIGKLSESFREMKAEIEKTETMRKALIANISHELRTPLTSINGFAQCMLDGIIPEDKRTDSLRIIKAESERLIGLTAEILELAKIQSGSIHMDLKALDLKAEVDQIKETVLMTVPQGGRAVVLNGVSPELRVMADRDRFKQIVINILNNAVKYSGDAVIIRIDAEKKDAEILLSIADNGPGVAESELPFLFDKFYRSGNADVQRKSGAGIGLSMVRELTELMHGRAEAEGNPDGGLTIRIALPASTEA